MCEFINEGGIKCGCKNKYGDYCNKQTDTNKNVINVRVETPQISNNESRIISGSYKLKFSLLNLWA